MGDEVKDSNISLFIRFYNIKWKKKKLWVMPFNIVIM